MGKYDAKGAWKKREEEKKNKKSTSNNSSSTKKYDAKRAWEERALYKSVNFDTFESDLKSAYQSLTSVYSGWQTKETMANTLSSVQSMYDRLNKYQDYYKKYGGTDLSEVRDMFKTAIDEWGGVTKTYGKYKNADAYNKEKSKLDELSKMTSADVEKAITNVNDLKEKLNVAKKLKSNIQTMKNKTNTWSYRSNGLTTDGGYSDRVKKAETELENYLNSIGYSSFEELEKATSGIAYTTVDGNNITWQGLFDTKKYKEDSEALYKDISSRLDFEKYKGIGANIKNPTWEEADGGFTIGGKKPFGKDVENVVEYAFANKDMMALSNGFGNFSDERIYYTHMTDQERALYNYYLGQEKEGVIEKGSASEYLASIKDKLKNRYDDNILNSLASYADDHPIIASGLSVGQSLASGVEYLRDGVNYLTTGKLDKNQLAEASSTIRNTVSSKVDWEIGNWDAFDFVYNTGMSMLDSTVAMATFGGAGGVALGLSATAQGTNDALERGLDNKSAFFSGLASGVFEGLFETYSISKLRALKDVPTDGVKSLIKNVGLSMLTNASEETLTELANVMYDHIANADFSQAETNLRAYMNSGMSEKEAIRKVAIEEGARIVEAGASGALMGLGFGGFVQANTLGRNNAVGKVINSNERVGDLFDIASDPETASAYEAYTQYANKGITADNISNAQLGNLYSSAKSEALNTLESKKSTPEQRQKALKTLDKLRVVETENTLKKEANKLNVGEDTKVTKTDEAINIKDLKIKGDKVTVATEKGEISVDDMTLTQNDAEFVALASHISKSVGEDAANMFISQYDGKTDLEEYQTHFNLAMSYAKDNFTLDTILSKKGPLSTDIVNEIYKTTVINEARAKETTLKNLAEKHGKTMTIKGVFDDSIIDYTNSTTDGSKVNWSTLSTTQRKAVKFAQLFSKATGVNIKFIKSEIVNGKHKGKNGSYDPNTNTIEIDVYAGRIDASKMIDSIIPTLSHELTHWMKAKSPVLFNSIREDVMSTLSVKTGLKSEELVARELKKLEKNHPEKTHTADEAIDEIVARACEDMLANSNEARKLLNKMSASEQQSFIEKVKETFDNLIQWVNDLLAHYKSDSAEARFLREYKHDLKRISKQWDAMLADAVNNNQALQKEGIRGEDIGKKAFKTNENVSEDVKNSIREEFAKEIEEWAKDGMPKGETFILGTTGDVLQGLGAIESDIYMLGKKITNILNDHPEMTIDEIKKIPQILDDPILILKSRNVDRNESDNTRIVIFGKIKAKDGRPILSVLDLRPVEENLVVDDMQKVSSAYTKDNDPVGFIRKSLVVYADKKRTTKLLRTIGFQMPIELQKSGYIGNISYIDQNVNISGEEFSKIFKEYNVQNSDRDTSGRNLSEGQQEYFKDSVNRDENGNLLVMYRGDTNDFTVFDRKKTNYANLYGRGFYFTNSKSHAEQYGNAREFYLNIKNPLSPDQNTITKKQMLNFLKAIENDGEDYDLYNYGQDATAESVLNSVWGKGDFAMLQDINAGAIGDLVAAVELFNEVNGTSYDGIILPTETVTFNSEQAKLTSNLNPTEDKDMRFSMRENVEETRDLIAVHNMQVSELERTLDLGGLPMPSIAIIKAKSGHSEYGDVSLVFDKKTIDPKGNKSNKVYGGDAWTPTYPTIEYKPNEKIANKISDKYYELSRKFGYDESRPLYNYVYDLERKLNSNKGETEMINELYDDTELMQLYLLDSGKNKVETIKKETRTELTDAEVEMNEFFISELGADVVDAVMWDGNGTPIAYRKNYISKYEDAIRDAYKKLLSEVWQFSDEQVQNVLDKVRPIDYLNFVRNAYKYRQEGRVTIKTEDDREATKKAIKDAVGDDYRKWVDSLFKGIEEKSGIRNNTELFTNSGNRRSWEALHWENNLENVVKVMKSQNDVGSAAIFTGHGIWGVSAKNYGSIEEIKADADRLKQLPEDEYNKIKENFGERLHEIAYSIMSKSERNPFIAEDNAMECIIEAVRYSKTKSGILKNLKQYQQLTVTETTVDDIVALVSDISNMPTEYFEAKPQRAVELNEVATAIIPDNTSDATKTRLDDMGIKYLEYESGNEESRLDALNSLEDLRFSERDSSYGEKPSIYDIMGETENLRKDYEKLEADFERTKEMLALEKKLTGGNVFNQNQLGAVAGHLRNIAKSNMDKVELMKALKGVYSYIVTEPNLTWEEVYEKCYRVAEAMLAEAKPITTTNDYAKQILKEIRNTRISLTEEQKIDASDTFDGNWVKYFFGKTIISNDGINIDDKWPEWASLYPDVFDADVGNNKIRELYDVINSLKEATESIDEYAVAEQTRWLASEIYNQYWNVSTIKTTADKYDAKLKRLQSEHRQTMRDLRDAYEEKLENQRLVDDMYYKRKMSELKSKDDAKLKERLREQREKQIELYKNLRERKDREIATAKQHGKDLMAQYKDNAKRKTVMQSMMATVMSLNKKLSTNSKDVHIPDSLKPVVINLLNSIDFSSKQLLGMSGTKIDARGTPTKSDVATEKALSKVHSMNSGEADAVSLKIAIQDALELFESANKVLDGVSNGLVDSGVVGLDVDMIKNIKTMIKDLDILIGKGETTFVLQKMSTDHLKTLNTMVKSINHWAIVADKALANKHKERISEIGMETVGDLRGLGVRQGRTDTIEDIKSFINWSNLLPTNAFKRLGNGAMKIFLPVREAEGKLAFNKQDIMDFMDKLLKDYKNYNPLGWRTDIKSFDLKLPNGDTKPVKMPVSFIMSLYCVSKQEDAKRHLYGMDKDGRKLTYTDENGVVRDGGGMTLAEFKDGKHTTKVSKDLHNTIVTDAIVKQITSVLTKEQREVADAMQKFMDEKGAEWGNAVSEVLYGIKKFGIEDYFPIKVSAHELSLDKVRDEKASLFSILNYGLTKERDPKAKQSIEIGDIFDVFANHMHMVAIYNAYALPIFDIARWVNFKAKTEKGDKISVTLSIEEAFGKVAVTYVNNLIKDLNGQHASSRLGFISKIFKNTKVAMVGNSSSVALLQPTAYFKAMTKISPKYLLKSLAYAKDYLRIKSTGVEKAKKYCGIALLKSQGYFETGVSANTTKKLIHDESWLEKRVENSLFLAGLLDERTWGVLWNACEFEVRATRKDLKVGSEEFYEVVGEKLADVIYETQVVDSPLAKSDLMRGADTGAKMLTMFAGEMTVAYNIVFEAVYQTHLDTKRQGFKEALKKNKKNIVASLMAYTLTSAITAAFNTAVQSFYDDDDEEKDFEDYLNQYLTNFFLDWLIIGKIPYLKETVNFYQGYSSSNPMLEWLESGFKAYRYWGKVVEGKDDKAMKAFDETLKTFSYAGGYALYNQWKNLRALLKKLGLLDD